MLYNAASYSRIQRGDVMKDKLYVTIYDHGIYCVKKVVDGFVNHKYNPIITIWYYDMITLTISQDRYFSSYEALTQSQIDYFYTEYLPYARGVL